MTYKVLLADDSETIKKVVKITLADEPYELLDCSNSDELFAILKSETPALIFLDFNLSEDDTGYDLCEKVLETRERSKVLMMFGHFDTIDEQRLKDCGASDKIIKPFDSSKFINCCRDLINEIEASGVEEPFHTEEFKPISVVEDEPETPPPSEQEIETTAPISDEIKDKTLPEMNLPDEFQVEIDNESFMEANVETHPIEDEKPSETGSMEWETNIPPVIGASPVDQAVEDLPPVIPDTSDFEADSPDFEEVLLPPTEDLEYPDLSDPELVQEIEAQKEKSNVHQDSENFKPINVDELEREVESQESEHADDISVDETQDSINLEDQIADEVEESIWKPDGDLEFEVDDSLTNDEPTELTPANPAAKDHTQMEKNSLELGNVEDQVRSLVEKTLEEYSEKKIEELLWEILPDIAEKVVKEEIQRLTRSVSDD